MLAAERQQPEYREQMNGEKKIQAVSITTGIVP